jgi:hypothetical protein
MPNHDGRVDEHADRDRKPAQAHEIRRHVEKRHEQKRDQRGQRQHERHGHGGAQVAQKQHEQHNHEHHGLRQRTRDRAYGARHEVAAIVKDIHLDAIRQRRGDLLELGAGAGYDVAGIRAAQPENQALHGFGRAVLGHGTVARDRAETCFGHVCDPHGYPVVHGHDDPLEIVERLDATLGAHQQGLLALADTSGTIVAVVGRDGLFEHERIDPAPGHTHGIRNDLEAPGITAEHVHVGHTRHGPQGRPNDPFQQRAPLGQARIAIDREHEHLAQRRRHRCHAALDTLGQQVLDIAEPLGNLLPGPVDVGTFGEIERDIGQRILRDGAQHGLIGYAEELHLDRRRDTRFDLLGRHARRLDDDLDLGRRDVGKRVDWQLQKRLQARRREQQRDEHDDHPLRE